MRQTVCLRTKNNKKEYINNIKDFNDLQRRLADRIFDYTEDEDGNALPDEECTLKDCDGNVLVQGYAAISSDTGVIEFDGNYDRYEVKNIDDCTDDEMAIIISAYNGNEVVDDDVLDAACDRLDYTHVHSVSGDRNGLDVHANIGSYERFGAYGLHRDHWSGSTREEFMEWLHEEVRVLPGDLTDIEVEVNIYDWFND